MIASINVELSQAPVALERLTVAYGVEGSAGDGERYRSSRGLFPARGVGSFPWSGATQALTLLLLRAAIGERTIRGLRGTPAVSLDYALSKEPEWLCAVFGTDMAGRCRAKRLLHRSNPNGKRPGAVSVTLLDEVQLEITFDGVPVGAQEIRAAAEELETGWVPYGTGSYAARRRHAGAREESSSRERAASPFTRAALTNALVDEVKAALSGPDIFERRGAIERASSVLHNADFLRIAGPTDSILHPIELELPASHRLGLADRDWVRAQIERAGPIRIAFAANGVGPAVLLHYIRDRLGYPLQLDSNFTHALEVGLQILKHDPAIDHDFCAIAHAPAASLIASSHTHDYEPCLFLPSCSQRVAAPVSAVRAGSLESIGRRYGLLHEDPSTASFYFEQLRRDGRISQDQPALEQCEPAEALRAIREGDPEYRAILFFPYFFVGERMGWARVVDTPFVPEQRSETLLFARSDRARDPKLMTAMSIAVRDAWYQLRTDVERLRSGVRGYLDQSSFLEVVARASGCDEVRAAVI